MKPHEINTAIAEWIGYKANCREELGMQWTEFVSPEGKFLDSTIGKASLCNFKLPNYYGDLNAIHEVEQKLDKIQSGKMADELIKVLRKVTKHEPWWLGPSNFEIIHAASAQRCEALLRTLNLWRES
jgi:hypothetical protein